MKVKIVVIISLVIVFVLVVVGSFLYVKNVDTTSDTQNTATNAEAEQNNEVKKVSNEHIVETHRFSTDWEWNESILQEFPDDERYHIKKDNDVNLMYNVIDSEEVYKEYTEKISSVLPENVDFNENFVILLTTEEFKLGPEEDLEIADITHSEDDGTMNIVLREREEPRENAYLNYNAWYAIVNDRSLLRSAVNIIIEQ